MALTNKKIYLASGSPRRSEILTKMGIAFEKCVVPVDETPLETETPAEMVMRLAEMKAKTLIGRYNDGIGIAADTTVELDGKVYGKPDDEQDAIRILKEFSGRLVKIHTGHAFINLKNNEVKTKLVSAETLFKELTDQVISDYVKTGEPVGKAGAFAVQGIADKILLEKVIGSVTNIMGLDMDTVRETVESFD